MTSHKLYELTSSDFRLPHHVDRDGKIFTSVANDIPTICWPDGTWCLPANIYMLDLYSRGRSRKNGGGTLLAYAANISHLLRYCSKNGIPLHNLSDNQFTFFMGTLSAERRDGPDGPLLRNSNSVINIGRKCLEFLHLIGGFYGVKNFVGPRGQILAELRVFTKKSVSIRASPASYSYWHHRSFPVSAVTSRRKAISGKAVAALRGAVYASAPGPYLRKRRYILLKLLEITGGRRSEVAGITIASVHAAARMSAPMLEVPTAKRRELQTRLIPISRYDVNFLIEFIEKNRAVLVRNIIGKGIDSGFLLVSGTTAQALRPNTITQEISILAKIAGIPGQTCPHMFRHRYITKLFVALIERHKFENVDFFRRTILCNEKIMREIQQWTGHSSLQSLEHYIDLAFEEISNFKKTVSLVQVQQTLSSFAGDLLEISADLEIATTPDTTVRRLLDMISVLRQDLDNTSSQSDD